jgi:hypothetical protein
VTLITRVFLGLVCNTRKLVTLVYIDLYHSGVILVYKGELPVIYAHTINVLVGSRVLHRGNKYIAELMSDTSVSYMQVVACQ